jgi:hypothetical protein
MKYLFSLCICASLFLSGCMTGRNPLSEGLSSYMSKAPQKAAIAKTKSSQSSIPRETVTEVSPHVSPVSASSSDTAHFDRF